MNPEKIHLAINHLPLVGLGFATVPLLIGLLTKGRAALLSGLIIAVLAGWSTALVMETGEEAYERYEEGPPRAYLDDEVETWLHIHEERAETWAKLLYLTAGLATLTLILLLAVPKYAWAAAWLTLVLCLASVGASIWIADSGGDIRRVDFRAD